MLDAAERIMLRDGYAALTSRRLEAEAGVKLHYHFGSIDDLFIAVVRRRGEGNVARLRDAFASPDPLRSWWRLTSEPAGNTLLVELTAAANHRPPLRAELAAFAREARSIEIDALRMILHRYGIDQATFPPALVAATVHGLAFAMAYDQTSGFETAHREASGAVNQFIEQLELRRSNGAGSG